MPKKVKKPPTPSSSSEGEDANHEEPMDEQSTHSSNTTFESGQRFAASSLAFPLTSANTSAENDSTSTKIKCQRRKVRNSHL